MRHHFKQILPPPTTIFTPSFCIFRYFLKTRLILFLSYLATLSAYSALLSEEKSPYNQGSIRHPFIVAYRPFLFPTKKIISRSDILRENSTFSKTYTSRTYYFLKELAVSSRRLCRYSSSVSFFILFSEVAQNFFSSAFSNLPYPLQSLTILLAMPVWRVRRVT